MIKIESNVKKLFSYDKIDCIIMKILISLQTIHPKDPLYYLPFYRLLFVEIHKLYYVFF